MHKMKKIAIDLGGTNLRVGLVQNGIITNRIGQPIENKFDLESTINQIKESVSQLLDNEVVGIGIGVPSVVDTQKGVVYNVANIPSWVEVPLKDILEKEFNKPVAINNDVNCFVLGEKNFGKAKYFQSVVGLAIGTGLGAGIIINGNLYEGTNCGAGEIGLLPYLEKDLEFYCSSSFFTELYYTTAHHMYERALTNQPQAELLWNQFGEHVGQAIKCIVLAYDPEIIVLGGSISKAFPFFSKSMEKALLNFPYPKSIEKLSIVVSENEDVHLLGATCLF